MFEPRGHDIMSGSILYPPTRADGDIAILFIETSGCLPMCGHGTIGTVTMRARARAGDARATRRTRSPRHARRPRRGALSQRRPLHRNGPAAQRDELPGGERASRSTVRGWVSSRWTSPMAAISTPSSSRSPSTGGWTALRRRDPAPVADRAPRRQRGGRDRAPGEPDDPRRQPRHVDRQAARQQAHARNAVFYGDKAIDRRPAAPAPRRAWPSSRRTGAQGRRRFVHESIGIPRGRPPQGEPMERRVLPHRRLPPYVFAEVNGCRRRHVRRAGHHRPGHGQSRQPAPAHIVDKLVETVRDGKTHRYSTSPASPASARPGQLL